VKIAFWAIAALICGWLTVQSHRDFTKECTGTWENSTCPGMTNEWDGGRWVPQIGEFQIRCLFLVDRTTCYRRDGDPNEAWAFNSERELRQLHARATKEGPR
jgi:hypothetical protein